MSFTKSIAAAAAALALSATGALAWDDAYRGTVPHNPTADFQMNAYPAAANYCPAGSQPVLVGGVICCGTPNAAPYVNRAGGHRKSYHAQQSYHAPRAYAPAGEKGVVYR